ncbi:orotidine-5'-phosphate decarboxylase [Mesohalobacter halotolerans]|uniref:Orotidine 5'-phosphate decarboxylase n=1 Tax=Mesohalobacter halotolerans TaxID=1883405 RepID=A0A4U5TSH7_9FLAO|nr:orotidine-5'-phosphate decarboxylase [Mesohalobacter halotolerans]MBS3738529.1 orotidine-5'-phosphate decarboxylase [Psychroflexus sp.]TKS56801.1 orotidine-5'-phosphate decarboxylase [Mesohalobacter halotolerans]
MELPKLIKQIRIKKSFLCVGLDTDLAKIPQYLHKQPNPVFEFNRQIIDATAKYAVAFKPNIAFYEALGIQGWEALKDTITYLNDQYPEIFTIADAKRGDIGNTASKYAQAFFENLNFDAITVAPYMGKDSIEPFLSYTNKHTILLVLTSNKGAFDFQTKIDVQNDALYESVLKTSKTWNNSKQLMYVVGATKPEYFKSIRKIVPNAFLLVPGVGAQGGNLKDVCQYGLTKDCGLLVNSSRGILYAANGKDFAKAAELKAKALQEEMASYV